MSHDFLKRNIDSIIAAILGFIAVQLFTRYGGIGISPDSIAYMSTARNLIAGNGFTDFSGNALVSFPLFYPFFLSIIMFITQTDIVQIAPILNGLLFGTLIFFCGIVLDKFKYKTSWYKRILLLILVCSPSLIEVYTMLWSETLFILLIPIFILFFQRYFQKHSYKSLFFAALIAAVAVDTRFAGITFVGTGCLLIFLDKKLNWKRKSFHIFLFGSIGISILSLNLIRNIIQLGLATGMRQKGILPLLKNIEYSGNVMSEWLTFQLKEQLFFEILAVSVMLLFVIFFIRNLRHWKAYYRVENVTVAFFIVYVLFIVISSTISRYEIINNRLLAPAFIPLLWISTCQIPKWRKLLPHKQLSWLFFAFSIGIASVLIGSYVFVNRENLSYMNETGIPGYSEDTWKKSQLVHYVQRHNELFISDSTVYSNHSQAVYFLTGNVVYSLPERVYEIDVLEFKQTETCLLIWFSLDDNTDLLSLKEIEKVKKMKLIKSFPDGSVYELTN